MTAHLPQKGFWEVRIRPAPYGGYHAEIPRVPGCNAEGNNWPELFRNLAREIEIWEAQHQREAGK